MTQQKGYILFITFSMLALCATLVSMFMIKGITHKKLSSALLQREKLQDFTVNCVAIAQSYLSISADELGKNDTNKQSESSEKKAPIDPVKKTLEKFLAVRNDGQKFNFEEIEKNFPVVINLTFFAESGKININGLYDLVQQKFYDEGVAGKDRKVFATWLFDRIAKITEKPSLLQPFIDHMKQRKSPLNDVTELLTIKEFSTCFADAIFYSKGSVDQADNARNKKIFLMDIFTVAHESDVLQPWLFSPSVCVLLDIAQKNEKNGILEKKEEKIDISSFKQESNWQKDWDAALKELYGIPYDKIPDSVKGLLATQFSSTVFSVMATVSKEDVIAQVFAILKQKRLPDGAIIYDVIKTYQV
ncbi:hypothetical protein [Candidatus Chromulinivorax destructor]|uniref:Type II secretion system protein K n=1 Tax=Candidatus Chromulinivorax destructor TaxID=2066483 RepID=A0A345ZBP6_9BACT|nr:hypothetical protein [Candidatus Chromulinivorax destructor]AXK60713.1 hypothetical protein C0J27_03075 [Candidatus Chromulinivorax destructor]